MPIRNNRIPQMPALVKAASARGVQRAAEQVADLARQLSPVDTGALRGSIRVEPSAPDVRMYVKAGGRGGVDYAAFVEYGTARAAAQPFLTPAARAIDVRIPVADEIRKALT